MLEIVYTVRNNLKQIGKSGYLYLITRLFYLYNSKILTVISLEVFTLNSRVTHKKNFLYNGGARVKVESMDLLIK
jgi:hypothetical protein